MKRNLIFVYSIISILIAFNYFEVNAQNSSVILEKIEVNNKAIKSLDPSTFVFSTKDKIEFFYYLKTDLKNKVPFRFIVNLKYQTNEYNQPTNTKSIIYSNLQENNYTITISALDPNNTINAIPLQLNFRISDREVELMKQLEITKDEKAKADEIIRKNGLSAETNVFTGPNAFVNIIALAVGILLITLAIFWIIKNSKNKDSNANYYNENINLNKYIGDNYMGSNIDQNDLQLLKRENSDLKAEVDALRAQIDNLNIRSSELSKQNNELKSKTDSLSKFNTELTELQKQKDDLFAMVIHDIKNPAGLVKGLVELLNSYDLSANEQKEIIQDIVTTTSRIVNLSQEVTKILSLESSSLHLNIEEENIEEIVSDIVHRNKINADKKQIVISTDFKPIEKVPVDAQKVDEIIDNLMSNAIKYSPKGASVLVTIRKDGDYAEISVKDNGLGLSQEDISNAFQRGVKLSATPTANEHSSGFGLWIVKKLTEAHKGKIKITSALGKGSTFTVQFPLKRETTEKINEETAPSDLNNN